MTMQLTDDQLRTIVAKAIFENVPPEKKEEMLIKALQSLMKADKYAYGGRQASELESAFIVSLQQVTREIVKEWLETPEVKAKVHAVVTRALNDAVNNDELQSALSSAIRTAFTVKDC